MTLVLASRSPQRRAILTQLGLEFRVVEPSYDELPLPVPPHELAERAQPRQGALGRGAARARRCSASTRSSWSTGRCSASRRTPPRRRACWRLLAGRTHEVVSGLTLRDAGGERTGHARTAVRFRALDAARHRRVRGARRVARSRRWLRHPGGGCRTRVEHRRMLLQRRRPARSPCWSRCWASAVAPFPGEE